jgi:hypothetical protein
MKFSRFLLMLPVVVLISFAVQAQEETPMIEGPDPLHRDVNFSEDKILIYDQPVQHPGLRDSVVIAPKATGRITRPENSKEAQKPKNEEDALKFNFLFYMIQKYKFSDMIEND